MSLVISVVCWLATVALLCRANAGIIPRSHFQIANGVPRRMLHRSSQALPLSAEHAVPVTTTRYFTRINLPFFIPVPLSSKKLVRDGSVLNQYVRKRKRRRNVAYAWPSSKSFPTSSPTSSPTPSPSQQLPARDPSSFENHSEVTADDILTSGPFAPVINGEAATSAETFPSSGASPNTAPSDTTSSSTESSSSGLAGIVGGLWSKAETALSNGNAADAVSGATSNVGSLDLSSLLPSEWQSSGTAKSGTAPSSTGAGDSQTSGITQVASSAASNVAGTVGVSLELVPTSWFQAATGTTTHEAAALVLRGISDKKIAGLPVNGTEEEMWETASTAMATYLYTPLCHEFFSTVENADAVCCESLIHSESIAFCTLKQFLPLNPLGNVISGHIPPISQVSARATAGDRTGHTDGALRAAVRFFNSYQGLAQAMTAIAAPELEEDTIYINLFDVQCSPPVNEGLCSQYCCAGSNAEGSFCNSGLECY